MIIRGLAFTRFLPVRTLMALVGAVACTTLGPASGSSQSELSPRPPATTAADGELAAFALSLVQNAEFIAQVWPGFWGESPRFMLLRDQELALLVTPSPPGPDYEEATGAWVPGPLEGLLFVRKQYPLEIPPGGFRLRYPAGSDTVPALPMQGASPFARAEFYLHEAFHGFQEASFVRRPEDDRRVRFGEYLVDPADLDEGFAAAAQEERDLLLLAMNATDPKRLELLRTYLAARQKRLRNTPAAAAVEVSMERQEGTATYVGCMGAAAALGAPGAGRACIVAELERDPGALPAMPEADAPLMRWRLYGTGAGLAALLDDLDVPGWKEEVRSGAALHDLLRLAVIGR